MNYNHCSKNVVNSYRLHKNCNCTTVANYISSLKRVGVLIIQLFLSFVSVKSRMVIVVTMAIAITKMQPTVQITIYGHNTHNG